MLAHVPTNEGPNAHESGSPVDAARVGDRARAERRDHRCRSAHEVESQLGRSLASVAVLAVVAGLLAVPSAAGAQTGGVYLSGAEAWTGSDCNGAVPIVVASDAAAQADIYSAVTLAGAVGTDCVVLAGPRGSDMPAAERSRLDAADEGGYVVGGEAAVPPAKVAGLQMNRVAGSNRWRTAQLVGREAQLLAPGAQPGAAAILDTTSGVPRDVQTAGLYLAGIGPWVTSDCVGDTAVVVASDARSQSDIYSAVTLAGVVGTDCVILAGPRSEDMPLSQSLRLGAADAGGYVVGGEAAVPSAKVAGRTMTRFSGTSRWDTAQLVGRYAAGDTTAGTTTTETAKLGGNNPTASGFIEVSSAGNLSCGLRRNGEIECWGSHQDPYTGGRTCRLAPSGELECSDPIEYELAGPFTAVSAGPNHACAIRPSGEVECWTFDDNDLFNVIYGYANAPTGAFTSVTVGQYHTCGLRPKGNIECWGDNEVGETDAPRGTFTAVSAGASHTCGLRTDGQIECWGGNRLGMIDPPRGAFTAVSAGASHSCALHRSGEAECWDNDNSWQVRKVAAHAVYALPNDAEPVKGREEAIANSIAAAQHWFRDQTGGKHPVFARDDDGDISVETVRLSEPAAKYADQSNAATTVARVRQRLHLGNDGKVAVFFEGRYYQDEDRDYCGWAAKFHYVMIPFGNCDIQPVIGAKWPDRGSYLNYLIAHELTHLLGAAFPCAPNYSDYNDSPGHVGDSNSDVIYGGPGDRWYRDKKVLDFGNDDYYRHGRDDCYDIADNPLLRNEEQDVLKFTAFSVGNAHSCGIRPSGEVECWGSNQHGQADAPKGTFTAVTAGSEHSCGIRPSGEVECWGSNHHGQLDAPR